MSASEGRLVAEVTGEVGKDDGVLAIRRVHVKYLLRASGADQDAIQRAFELHAARCPVYHTLHRCIEITTELSVI